MTNTHLAALCYSALPNLTRYKIRMRFYALIDAIISTSVESAIFQTRHLLVKTERVVKMLSQKEIQDNHAICLELLDTFTSICEKNGIDYYLAFGSCLGAVRHKGFIPWDINVDVLMTADQFQKLDQIMSKEHLENMRWCRPANSARIYPLLMRNDSWDYESKPNIDVAVYCNAPNNRFLRMILRIVAYINIKMFKLKNTAVSRTFPYNIFKGISSIFPNAFYERIVHRYEKLYKGKETEYQMVILPSVPDDREYLMRKWIGVIPHYAEFEGRKVRVIEDCDSYLRMRYGNSYMTPKVWEDKGEFKHAKK